MLNRHPKLNQKTSTLKPLDAIAVQVFSTIHKKLCAVDGLLPEEALVALCHLITIKVYDEQVVAKGGLSQFQRDVDESDAVIAGAIRTLYGLVSDDNAFDLGLMLSDAAIREAVGLLEGYSMTEADPDMLGCAFQVFMHKVARKTMGQYFTPAPIVTFMVDVMAPTSQNKVIDPFCGTRNILLQSFLFIKTKLRHHEAALYEKNAYKQLHGIEKSQRMHGISQIYDLTREEAVFNVNCGNALTHFINLSSAFKPDHFDLVMTNPPFGTYLSAREIEQLGDFELAKNGKGLPVEVLAVERSVQFLKPEGRLAIIIPDGLLSGKASRKVRDWLAKQIKILGIISLPIETFTSAGAAVKTSLLFGAKRNSPLLSEEEDYAIFMGKIDDLDGNQSDLEHVKSALLAFIDERGW